MKAIRQLGILIFFWSLSLQAQDQIALSDLIRADEHAGFGDERFEFDSNLGAKLKEFFVFPGIQVILRAYDADPSQKIQIWIEKREGQAEGLSGTKDQIIEQLSVGIETYSLNALQIAGDRFIFFRTQKKWNPHLTRNALQSSAGAAIIVTNMISKGRLAKKILTVAGGAWRSLRGLQVTATAVALSPTPEKAAVPAWVIELGAVVVIEVAIHYGLSAYEFRMTRNQTQEALLLGLKNFEENLKTPQSAASQAALEILMPRILQGFEDLQLLINIDANHKVAAATASISDNIQKLEKRREKDEGIYFRTKNFTTAYSTRTKKDKETDEEILRNELETFQIHVPYPRLREYQEFRRNFYHKMKNREELKEAKPAKELRAYADRLLKDAFYLYLFRKEFDEATNSAIWDLTTPQKAKRGSGIGSLGVTKNLEENLKDSASASKLISSFGGTAVGIYKRALASNKFPKSSTDVLILEFGFVQALLANPIFQGHLEIEILRDALLKRIQQAQSQRYDLLAEDYIRGLKSRWENMLISEGAGLDFERAYILKGLISEQEQSPETRGGLETWMEADFQTLLR